MKGVDEGCQGRVLTGKGGMLQHHQGSQEECVLGAGQLLGGRKIKGDTRFSRMRLSSKEQGLVSVEGVGGGCCR